MTQLATANWPQPNWPQSHREGQLATAILPLAYSKYQKI